MRRHYHSGIPTVHPGKFDMFQHTSNQNGFTIGNAVNIHFDGILEKLINEYRLIGYNSKSIFDHLLHAFGRGNDKHAPTAQNKGRSQQNREAQFLGHLTGLFRAHSYTICWLL